MTVFAIGILIAVAVLIALPARPHRTWSSGTLAGADDHSRRVKPWLIRPRRVLDTTRQAQSHHIALVMDLLAASLRAGSPVPAALRAVAEAVNGPYAAVLLRAARRMELGAPASAAWVGCPVVVGELARVLTLVESAGVPAEGLLRSAAGDLRRRTARDSEAAAARLGVRLVLPLGLCALPAFIAWSVVPVVLSLTQAFG